MPSMSIGKIHFQDDPICLDKHLVTPLREQQNYSDNKPRLRSLSWERDRAEILYLWHRMDFRFVH